MLFAIYISILILSFLCTKAFKTPKKTVLYLSKIIFFVYPCLAFASITSHFNRQSLIASSHLAWGSFSVLTLGYVFGAVAKRRFFTDSRAQGTYHFLCAVPNYIFLPLLLTKSFWGDQAVSRLILTTLGSEAFLWTLGLYALVSGKPQLKQLINPPLLAILAAVAAIWADIRPLNSLITTLQPLFKLLGQATIPTSVMILGISLGGIKITLRGKKPLWALTLFKLILVPSVTLCLLSTTSLPVLDKKIIFLISTMPAAIATLILTEIFKGDTSLAAEGVFFTHIGSIATIPIWLELSELGIS